MEEMIIKKIIQYCGFTTFCVSICFPGVSFAQDDTQTAAGSAKHTYEIHFPENLLEKVLLHSGNAVDSTGIYGTVIRDGKVTLHNRELGKTSAAGEIQVVSDDTIKFIAEEKLRFSPGSDGTSVTFGTLTNSNDTNSAFVVYTGKWINFFGIRICPGQTFDIPGESQCI